MFTGVPSSSCSSSSLENMLLFNSPSVGPDAPKIEDLKWHSAFFRKQMGTSLVHSLKKPHKRDPLQNSPGSEGKTPLKQPDLGGRREGTVGPESFLSFEKTFAEARLISAQQKNGVVTPDHGNRRDHRFQCDLSKGDLKDRPLKQSHKPLRSTDVSQRHVDHARAAASPGAGQSAPGTRREAVPKCNGSLVRVNYNQSAVKVPTTPASPVKNWGGFRIPKKGERQQQGEAPEGGAQCPPPGRVHVEDFGIGGPGDMFTGVVELVGQVAQDGHTADKHIFLLQEWKSGGWACGGLDPQQDPPTVHVRGSGRTRGQSQGKVQAR